MRQAIMFFGEKLISISRFFLRASYGLRIPAARIKLIDRQRDLIYCVERLEQAKEDVSFWEKQVKLANEGIRQSDNELSELYDAIKLR